LKEWLSREQDQSLLGKLHDRHVQQQEQENKACGAVHKKKHEKFDEQQNNKDSSVVELKGKKYSISKLDSQVDIYTATTTAIGEYVGS
jgi:hypothetical protein